MVQNDLFFDSENDYVDYQVKYWRERGFPDYRKEDYSLEKELSDVIMFDEKYIVSGDLIGQTMHGLGLLWSYFPHWKHIKYHNDNVSLIDKWNDDNLLRILIEKTYAWECKFGNGYITENRLRQNSKVYMNKQTVSNFRPTVAKYIYNTYGNKGVVYDMSAGFGGRLFGFLSSGCKKYIGVDPSSETYKGLLNIKKDYEYIGKDVEIHNIGSENFIPHDDVDLCFTSPPYFNTEIYSDEPTQACNKYNNKQHYIEGFMKPTYKNAISKLKNGGNIVINIANTTTADFLEQSTIDIIQGLGCVLMSKMNMVLSSIAGNGIKTEPVYIFVKKD